VRKFILFLVVVALGVGSYFGLREDGFLRKLNESTASGARQTTTSTLTRGAGTSSSSSTTFSSSSTTSTSTSKAGGATTTSTGLSGATTTFTGPSTTTTTLPATTTTAPGGSVPDCGHGVAKAVVGVAKDADAYEVTVTVRNEADRAVELDTLAVRISYPGPRTANYPSDATKFAGIRIEPGQEIKFAIRESRAKEAPNSFEVAEFSYHTVGLPQCKSS